MAKPLCGRYEIGKDNWVDTGNVTDDEGPRFISAALSDSLRNCHDFINTFTTGQAASNTFFDTLSLALSGLATVFVPANTVRALSGASTIAQGTKGALNSDFYQQLTIQLFIQTINGTYFKEYSDFLSSPPKLLYPEQYNQIELFHKDCSIPFAAAQISAKTATPVAAPAASITTEALKQGAKFKDPNGDIYTISVKGSTYSYQVTRPDGTNTSPTPQQATPEALVALLNSVHAVAQ